MKAVYDLCETRYICTRCSTPICVESDSFYSFSGPDDGAFWCPTCEDLPSADIVGTPAENLPMQLQLGTDFTCRIVPLAEPRQAQQYNLLYRPYSKRSFLRQYVDHLMLDGMESCSVESFASVSATFDRTTQQYTVEPTYEIADTCSDRPCVFLQSRCLRPPDTVDCPVIKELCDTRRKHGLCDTGDEAMLLQWYLLITGAEHFPMLLPQVSILKGKRRADFICFVPITKFQYQRVAVLVDRPGKDRRRVEEENGDYEQAGFTVRRIEIGTAGESYFKLARDLATWIEHIPRG